MIVTSPLQLYAAPYSYEALRIIQLQWKSRGVEEIVSGVFMAMTDGYIEGVQHIIQWLSVPAVYDNAAIGKLMSVRDDTGVNVFSESFLNYLQRFNFGGEVWAVKEATAVFAGMPVLQVKGGKIQVAIIQLWVNYLLQPNVKFQTATNFLQVRRFYNSDSTIIPDIIYALETPPIVNFEAADWEDLLQPIFIENPKP